MPKNKNKYVALSTINLKILIKISRKKPLVLFTFASIHVTGFTEDFAYNYLFSHNN